MPKEKKQKKIKHTRNNSPSDSSNIRRQTPRGQNSQDLAVVLAPDPTLSSLKLVKRRVNASSPSHDGETAILNNTPVDNSTSMYHARQVTIRGDTFTGAHDFIIQNANIGDGIQREEWRSAEQERRAREERINAEERKARLEARDEIERRTEEERQRQAAIVLEKLAGKGLPSAMLDSKERTYAPACNGDTRRTIRSRIVKWVHGKGENRRLLWLFGPAAVGKSAVAQIVAEELKQEGLLGAVFFFSRPNNRSDPDVVIPTLVYQLALWNPEYRRIITQKLTMNPILLSKNRRSLFHELIIEPVLALTFHQPPLVILDGLDECRDRDAQCEFIQMIMDYVKEGKSRLRWAICSRAEPDLKSVFFSEDCQEICLYEELDIDHDEAQADAKRILVKGFEDIRKRFSDQVTQDWPAENDIQVIANHALGHLGFAAFIVRFVGDKEYDDPSGQLKVCLKFLQCHGTPEFGLHPLHALDLLYTQILSDIPVTIFPITQRILGISFLYHQEVYDALALANFLGLDRATFYRALRCLHSVLFIPPPSGAGLNRITAYHASFTDYLKDKARSGKLGLNEDDLHLHVALRGLRWLDLSRGDFSDGFAELSWAPSQVIRLKVLLGIYSTLFESCWLACTRVPRPYLAPLIEALENFDFGLDYSGQWSSGSEPFVTFIQWLASLDPSYNQRLISVQQLLPYSVDDCSCICFGDSRLKIHYQSTNPSELYGSFFNSKGKDPINGFGVLIQLGRANRFSITLHVDDASGEYESYDYSRFCAAPSSLPEFAQQSNLEDWL